VDDEPVVLEFQKAFLTRHSHKVFTAANTQQALQAIKDTALDIVFCDVKLDTDSSGLDILAQAKKIKPNLAFYLISGFLDKEIEEKGLQLGAKGVLNKPIKNEDLEKKISEATI